MAQTCQLRIGPTSTDDGQLDDYSWSPFSQKLMHWCLTKYACHAGDMSNEQKLMRNKEKLPLGGL